ncbi:hypothetical protein KAR10_07920 [bacterium]|nr:hypothetical protein [bacterium]
MNKSTERIIENIQYNIFSDVEVSNLFSGSANSRYGLIKRAARAGYIHYIRRGLYSLAIKYQHHKINLYQLAQYIYGPSYISLESALAYHGWIPDAVPTITNACMKKSQDYETPLGFFSYKRIPAVVFYEGVERMQAENGDMFFMAHPFKALVDYVYIYKKAWQGLEPAIASLRIDAMCFENLQLDELNSLQENYSNHRVQKFIAKAKQELGYEH